MEKFLQKILSMVKSVKKKQKKAFKKLFQDRASKWQLKNSLFTLLQQVFENVNF